jgi:hypothetical protein
LKIGVRIAGVKPEQVEPDRLERGNRGREVALGRAPRRTDLRRLGTRIAMRLTAQRGERRQLLDARARCRGMRLEARDDSRQI